MRKISNSTRLATVWLCAGLACSVSIIAPQTINAQEQNQGSLIESALDGKLDEQTVNSLGQSQPATKAPLATTPSSIKASEANSKKNKREKNLPDDPNKPVVKLLPAQRKTDDGIAQPPAVLEPPIHSAIPASQKSFLKIPLGLKLGESTPIDMTYRGKPTIPNVSTVTFGAPSWAIPPKKKVAGLPNTTVGSPSMVPVTLSPASGQTPAAPVQAPRMPAAIQRPKAGEQKASVANNTVNFRFLTTTNGMRPTDSIWIYPYPPKPPKSIIVNPLPELESQLKAQLLSFGYSNRPDPTRPYPLGGVRWIRAFENARQKAGIGVPHTMITMYPWVNKMFPYMLAECMEMNKLEQERCQHYQQMVDDYERIHVDLESQATARGLAPIEVKINSRGIGQIQVPAGNWWIAATRKTPGLKFYWQVPVSCAENQTINIQLNEANALICGGGW